jgi:hypothetical protein
MPPSNSRAGASCRRQQRVVTWGLQSSWPNNIHRLGHVGTPVVVAEQHPPSEVSALVCVMEELVDKLGVLKINSSCVNDDIRSGASICKCERGSVNSVAIKQEYDGC